MDNKLLGIFKSGNIVIPLYIFQNYKQFDIELSDFIFMMYLYNKGNNNTFNPKRMSIDLNITESDVMREIAILSDKKLIELKVVKNEKNIREEVISLDLFYSKLSRITMDILKDDNKEETTNCFDFIQKEFGRTLSPIEVEIIKAWIEDGNSDELIKEAVKEAVFNGVNNLRYIDKILYEWDKKGLKTKEDVDNNRSKHRETKKKEEQETVQIFDYNWFDDDE